MGSYYSIECTFSIKLKNVTNKMLSHVQLKSYCFVLSLICMYHIEGLITLYPGSSKSILILFV